MTEDVAVTISQIRTLVSERQRFDEWLTALEARREETPERVFLRVHGDYIARRDGVVAQLHEHVGTLESIEQDLNSRLHALETQLVEREDERAEAMLRTAVGEFDSERWENTRHDVEASISKLGANRESLTAEVEDTRSLLASARHKPAKAAIVEPEIVPVPIAEPVAAPVVPVAEVPAVVAPTVEAIAPQLHDHAADDIEAAFAVTDDALDEEAYPHEMLEPYVGPTAAATHSGSMDAQLDVDVDAAVNMLHEAPGATAPETLDHIDVFGEPAAPVRANDGASSNGHARPSWASEPSSNGTATRDAFDDLAFLRSVTETGSASAPTNATGRGGSHTEQAKTLRCTECGTMNFPTEWYCERCGGGVGGVLSSLQAHCALKYKRPRSIDRGRYCIKQLLRNYAALAAAFASLLF